jgi:hypothetical protein
VYFAGIFIILVLFMDFHQPDNKSGKLGCSSAAYTTAKHYPPQSQKQPQTLNMATSKNLIAENQATKLHSF